MNIYLVSRKDSIGYDEWDAFVVAAPDEATARDTYPTGDDWHDSGFNGWVGRDYTDSLIVELIGTTNQPAGVILASYNAG